MKRFLDRLHGLSAAAKALLCAGGALSCLAFAGQAMAADGPAWSGPGWQWGEPQTSDLPEARLTWQYFSARQKPADVARHLTAAKSLRAGWPNFTRVQWFGPVLQLSGPHRAGHWLVQLYPARGGTRGLVSSLRARSAHETVLDTSAFVPPGAQRLLQARIHEGRAAQDFSSFRWQGDLPVALRHLDEALHRAGWHRSGGHGSMRYWRHPRNQNLSVVAVARAEAVVLTFWHPSLETP